MVEIIIFIVGCAVSWLIAHLYYHRSGTQTSAWAEELVRNLPAQKPNPSELLRLFQEHLDSGDVEINYTLGRVACPECNSPVVKDFEEKVFGDDAHTVVVFTCPKCGWTEDAEV